MQTNIYNSISGRMTLSLSCYSAVFMRYALAVSPKNYLLFGCHVVNFSSQITQGYRFLNYWKYVTHSCICLEEGLVTMLAGIHVHERLSCR
jgi:hypothetical protein